MRLRAWTAGVVAMLAGAMARGAEPPTDPILRIETGGQHTAMINRLAVDRAERMLLTGSDDKTVRVWDLQTGALRRVVRPPIGPGDEGKIYAVAVAPDGKLAATGGWTQFNQGSSSVGPDGFTLYLFNPATGEMVRRIGGLPNVVFHLAWSADGARVAAVLGSGGLRVFRAADGAEVARDADYGNQSYGAAFTRDGGLVTTCWDGHLRRYGAAGTLEAKVRTPGGERPFQVAVAPDGRLAVGYHDSTAVDLFDGKTLRHLGSADTAGISGGNLGSVTFTRDGARLAAGGRYGSGGYTPLLLWPFTPSGTAGTRDVVSVAKNSVMDLRPLGAAGVVFASWDPKWGIVTPGGGEPFTVGPATADLRKSREAFKVAADAGELAFAYQNGADPATFSLPTRTLRLGASTDPALTPPRTTAPGLAVTDWTNNRSPKRNGQPLALQQYETARSLALAPDAATFALGADWSLRLFAADGTERWQNPVPEAVWGVNIPADGRTVVAAFGDGTIRWFRHSDGAELLAFFPHADRQRWVLWTPSGYYDCSAGAEELIGWHVNRGLDQMADFFPASRFRDQFYRPDVIDRILTDLDEGQAVRLANQARGRQRVPVSIASVAEVLPPVVSVSAPLDGATVTASPLTITYTVRTAADAPVTRVWALIDGRPAEEARALGKVRVEAVGTGPQTLSVPVPERDCEIAVLAENRHGASVPFKLRVRWAGATPTVAAAMDDLRPKMYALAVGVSDYKLDSIGDLRFAAKDAADFSAAVAALEGGLYRDVEVRTLTDAAATRDDVVDGLDWLGKATTSRDVAVLFLAGHGVNDSNNLYYYLPHNADPEKLLRSGVKMSDVRDTLASIAGKAVFFVDSCHSGNVLGAGTRPRQVDVNGLVNEMISAENGAVVFTATTGRQLALESTEWNNGAFTKAVVEGLSGKAAQKGKVTIATMDFYISERVKELTDGKQTPVVRKPDTVPDFPIALAK